MVIIAYPKETRKEDQSDLMPTSKYEELEKEYHCQVFEVSAYEFYVIGQPFYYLLKKSFDPYDFVYKHTDTLRKDPFDEKGKFKIGMFGCSFKINLMHRYMYGQYYQPFCQEYKEIPNFTKMMRDLSKTVEIDIQFIRVYLIDSTLSKLETSIYYLNGI